jgi:transcriptional regulator with XRE-family HTH domain
MNIADRIQHLRKTRGISQEELADKVGVSRQAVSKWESEQSIPDLDKVIIMSDFFEVTTDYILKGIEAKTQVQEKTGDARIFLSAATALNFIGLIVACAVWYEQQILMATASGLIFMAMGCMIFGIGVASSTKNVGKAKRAFWMINIWLLVFIPLSFVYNTLLRHHVAPYPMLGNPLVAYPIFWLVYIAACLAVVLTQARISRRK